MTLDDLKSLPGNTLLPKQVAQFLGMDPNAIRYMARAYPEMLGFPVQPYKTSDEKTVWHYLIPKEAFVRWVESGKAETA